MQNSLGRFMSHDMKDFIFKVQSWEKSMLDMFTNIQTNVNLVEDKLGELEHIVKDYRKSRKAKHRRDRRQFNLR